MEQTEHVQNERRIMSMMNHPNVVRLYGTFQDRDSVYLMTEFIGGGELFFHLYSGAGFFDLDTARYYAAELFCILEHVHSHQVVYRDLKPENLLFNMEGHLKLIDFGFAKEIVGRTYTLCGTPDYLGPEVIQGEGSSFASDWWSYGCLVYEMINGFTPFHDDDENEMYLKILRGEYPTTEAMLGDELACELIQGLLQVEVTNRLGGTALGSDEIKFHPYFEGIDWDMVSRNLYEAPLIPGGGEDTDEDGFPSTFNFPDCSDQLEEDVPVEGDLPEELFAGF